MRFAGAIFIVKLLLSISLFAIFVVPVLLVILVFSIYRTLVFTILKLKFGSKFGGIISSSDVICAADTSSKNVINVIWIAKTSKSFPEYFRKFKEIVNIKVFQNSQQPQKLLSTRHKMGGYHYFIPNQVEINECVRSLKFDCKNEEMSKEELLKEISKYSNRPLPYNNTAFWEFLLCENPVKWNNRIDKTEKSYAILLRFHHSLTDGVTILNLVLNIFYDSSMEKEPEVLPAQNSTWNNVKIKFFGILDSSFTWLIAPIVLLSEVFSQHEDVSSVNLASLSEEQIMVCKVEESKECLKIIKDIKRQVGGTSFVDVLFTAVSKSFSNYFEKTGKDPNLTCFNIFLTILMRNVDFSQLSKSAPNEFRNVISYASYNIPIIYETNAEDSSYRKSFLETLKKVTMETNKIKASYLYKVTFEMFQVIAYFFPEPIVLRLLTPPNIPCVLTNIPGSSANKLFDDCFLEDVVYWVPRVEPIAMTLGFFTFDGRLQISLNVDKAIISNEQEAQDLVDGIYQALIQLKN